MIHKEVKLHSLITQLESQEIDLTTFSCLFDYIEFRTIYNNSELYLEQAILELEKTGIDIKNKIIISLAMQSLKKNDYLCFANALLRCLISRKISHKVFEIGVFPPYDWNTCICENFTDVNVISFLEKTLQTSCVNPVLKRYISQKILSGIAYQEMLGFINNK